MTLDLGTDILTRHGEFVRALAGALLRDPGKADDVTQEVLVRSLRHPAAHSNERGWLATLVRNLVRNEQRDAERRQRREHAAARPEALAAPEEGVLASELVQRVAAAVGTLEAPYREVIEARYYRGLCVSELVRQSGTKEDTLRARERRALELLRAKLDRDFGRREAWAVALATLAPRPAGAAALPPLVAGLAGAALVAAGVAGVLWLRAPRPTPAPSVASLALSLPPAPAALPAAREPASSAAPAAAALGSSSSSGSSTSSALTSAQAELRATLLLEGGAPAAQVPWTVSGWEANDERVIQHGLPEAWTDPSGTTDANGLLVARFEPPRAFQFVLDVKAPGHAGASWRWSALEPGKTVDLGSVTLPRGATVVGRLVDAEGAPILGETWSVYADSVGLQQREGRDETRVRATLDPATGAFRLEDVHPGRVELKAYNRMANWLKGQFVTALGGQTLTADLVYRGPRSANRITVTTFCRPYHVMSNPDPAHLRLRLPDGSLRTAAQIPGSSQSHSFDGLAPGSYSVEIDDPRYLPFAQHGLTPGSEVRAELQPCSAVVLSVRDASGAAVTPDHLTVEFQNVNFLPKEILVHDGSASFEPNVRLFPGSYVLHVRAGEARGSFAVQDLGFDELRPVTFQFGSEARLAGQLRAADGTALVDAPVLLLAPASEGDSEASPILGPNSFASNAAQYRKQLAEVRTDEAGAFAFQVAQAGRYVLHAEAGLGLRVSSPVLELAAGEARTDLALTLPPGATVTGRLLAPAGVDCSGLRLSLGSDDDPMYFVNRDQHARPLAADGSFHLEDLPAGTVHARLLLANLTGFQSAWEELGTLELVGGSTLTRDFTLASWPGAIALQATVDGEPVPGLRVTLERDLGAVQQHLEATLDASASPIAAFAGTWKVRVADPGRRWIHRPASPVLVPSGGTATLALALQVAPGTLRFLDAAGQPLAGQRIRLQLDHPDEQGPFLLESTDATGHASFTLVPADYLFSLDAGTPARVTWTSTGPTSSDVQL